MVRAYLTQPRMVMMGLDMIQGVRDMDLSVGGTKLRAAERRLRSQVLVGFDPREPGSAPQFWVNKNVQRTLLRISKRPSIERWCCDRGYQISLLRDRIDSMPASLPALKRKAYVIQAVDVVRGVQRLLKRVPEARDDWPAVTVRNAIAVWWGYRRMPDLARVFQERGLIEEVRDLDPDIAKLLEGDSPESLAPRKDRDVGAPISQFYQDLVTAITSLMDERPDLEFASYEERTTEIAAQLGLKPRSVRRRLQRDARIQQTLVKINKDAWDFVVLSEFHHRLARAVDRVMREQPDLEDASYEQKFVAIGEKLGITSGQVRNRLKKYPHIVRQVRALNPEAADFLAKSVSSLSLLATSRCVRRS